MSNHERNSNGGGYNNRRITIKGARRILGMISRNYTDDDIQEILDVLYGIAEEGYEIYSETPDQSERSD